MAGRSVLVVTWPAAFFFPHVVAVQDLTGSGGMGETYGPSRDVVAEVIDERTILRGQDGQEVVSSTRVTVPLEAEVPVGSLVTVWPGGTAERTAEVLRVGRDDNPPPLPSHLVLYLT